MIAESSVPLSSSYFSEGAMNHQQVDSGSAETKTRKDIVDELLSFTWSDTKFLGSEVDNNSRSCGQDMNKPISHRHLLGRPVKSEEHVVPFSNHFRSYSTSDLLDLSTVVKDLDEPQNRDLYPASDLRIPEYELGVINEENTAHHTLSRHSSDSIAMQRILAHPNAGESGFAMATSDTVRVSTLTDQKSLAQFTDLPALQARVKSEHAQNGQANTASSTDQKPVRTKRRFIRRRSSERKPFENVPDFVKDELNTTSGIGHFTMSELMCCLLFAHREALSSNSYANIRAKMGNKRSRVSIRRKIEKIVLSETGLSGGLLGLTSDQNQLVLEAIWNRLMNLISDAETYGTANLKIFASQLREYSQNPLKFAPRK